MEDNMKKISLMLVIVFNMNTLQRHQRRANVHHKTSTT